MALAIAATIAATPWVVPEIGKEKGKEVMMKRTLLHTLRTAVFCLCVAGSAWCPVQAQTIGGGVHYWKALKDIKLNDIDEDGLAWLASVQLPVGDILQVEGTLEVYPEGFAGQKKTSYAPQAALVIGRGLYGAAGIGIAYADGDFADDPFYVFRAGFNIELLPNLYLDLNAQYRFMQWEDLEDKDNKVSADTIMLAALLRLKL